eukprot:8313402-Pyramimonas_sp.AAC.1
MQPTTDDGVLIHGWPICCLTIAGRAAGAAKEAAVQKREARFESSSATSSPPLIVPSPPSSQEEPGNLDTDVQHRGGAIEHEVEQEQETQEKMPLGQDRQTREEREQKDEDGQSGIVGEAHRRGTSRGHRDGNRRLRTGNGSSHAASQIPPNSSGGARHAVDKEAVEDHHQNRVTPSDRDVGISKVGEESAELSSPQLQPSRTSTRSGLERSEYKSSLEQ